METSCIGYTVSSRSQSLLPLLSLPLPHSLKTCDSCLRTERVVGYAPEFKAWLRSPTRTGKEPLPSKEDHEDEPDDKGEVVDGVAGEAHEETGEGEVVMVADNETPEARFQANEARLKVLEATIAALRAQAATTNTHSKPGKRWMSDDRLDQAQEDTAPKL